MQCRGAIYHLVDPKIDKNRQNPQDTCSKIPGRVFSEVAEAPQADTTHRTARGGLKPVKMTIISRHRRQFQNIDFSLFVDAANVWGVDYDSAIDDNNKIRSSTGVAMDILTPIGPLNFSLSQPITKSSTDKTESFRFNLGTTF